MPTINLNPYKPVADTDSDAALFGNAYDVLQTLLNGGLDNNNIAASAGIVATKLSVAYAAYTPTWTASGTAPAIGNATVVAKYAQIGKFIHAYGLISFGTTSTYGTGSYSFALPVTAGTSGTYVTGQALLYDSSANAAGNALAFLTTTTTMTLQYGATYLGTLTPAGQLAPWTWATSDIISWNITYEAA